MKRLAVMLLALLPMCVMAQTETTLTVDVTNQTNKAVDLSAYTALQTLTIKGGATSLTLGTLTSTTFTLEAEECSDLVVNMGNQPNIRTLTLTNLNQIDISGCSALQTLTCQGTDWGDLTEDHLGLICNTGATAAAPKLPALAQLDASGSGVQKIDLTNAAMNLTKINIANSTTRELYLPNHTGINYYSTTTRSTTDNTLIAGYNSITPQYYVVVSVNKTTVGSWNLDIDTNRLEVLDLSGCGIKGGINPTITSTSTSLSTYNITPTTSTTVYFSTTNGNYNKGPLRELNLSGGTFVNLYSFNLDLTKLDVSNNTSLQKLFIDQNFLTTVNLSGCSNLVTFNAKRNQFQNVEFLTEPSEGRPAEYIAKLLSVQLNGGAYSTSVWDAETGGPKVIIPALYTNKIKNFNTQYLDDNLQSLLIADNLLEVLDLHSGLTSLNNLECENNMLLTLDLSNIQTTNLKKLNAGSGLSDNKMQVGFRNVEVLKGTAEDGSQDWIALHAPNGGGYEHLENLNLYPTVEDAKAGINNIASEAEPFMGTIAELNAERNASLKDDPENPDPNKYLFLHSMAEVLTENNGKVLDHDLYDNVLTYRYNTNFNGGQEYTLADGKTKISPYIEIRVHLYPYILNINPATKNATGNPTGTDYYSSTIMLDYDAVIPNGAEVYVVTGFQEGFKEANQPNDPYDAQLVLQKIGGPGEVLPANTPVIVRSDEAAGLYDFQTAWDFDYKGWEDYRSSVIREAYAQQMGIEDPNTLMIPKLHGVHEDNVVYKAAYDPETYPEKWVNLKQSGANATAIANNLLQGTTEEMTVASKSILTLGRQKNETTYNEQTGEYEASYKLGFWKYKATTLPAHRCYITVEDMREALNNANMNPAKEGGAFLFDGNATGIQSVAVEKEQKGRVVYDLQGRRVTGKPTPGIYIVNGKKVVIK